MGNRRWWSVGALVLLLAAGIVLWNFNQRSVRANNSLEASYQRALFSMVEHVQNLNTLLAKGHVIQDTGQGVLTLASAWHEAESARSSLGQLPLGRFNLTAVQKYLAQVGDFSYSCARKLAQGKTLDEKEQETLALLSEETDKLNRDLQTVIGDIKTRPNWGTKGVTVGLKGEPVAPSGSVADRLAKMDGHLKDQVPAITYDGPFSEHVAEMKPRAVSGDKVTIEQAGRIAEDFVNKLVTSGRPAYRVTTARRVNSNIPAYSLMLRAEGNRRSPDIMVDVSQTGGHVIHMFNPRPLEEATLDIKTAVEKGEAFIRAAGYDSMITTGSLRHPQTLMVTQVWQQDETVCYPDFVKVTVALDNGEITAFDARGYLTSHRQRELSAAKFSGDDARDRAAARLTIDRIRPAVIPMSDNSERQVWEVKGRANDQTFLIYYNNETGREEKVLQVIESPDGTYTM
ncbi:MAG: germination protein YpeB [bacterium]